MLSQSRYKEKSNAGDKDEKNESFRRCYQYGEQVREQSGTRPPFLSFSHSLACGTLRRVTATSSCTSFFFTSYQSSLMFQIFTSSQKDGFEYIIIAEKKLITDFSCILNIICIYNYILYRTCNLNVQKHIDTQLTDFKLYILI